MALESSTDYDSVIAALESLVTRLEDAQPAPEFDIAAAASESAELVERILPPDERSSWDLELREALAADHVALSEKNAGECVPVARNSYRPSIGVDSPTDNSCQCERAHELEASSRKQKACVHGCGMEFCNVECWKVKRRKHEMECIVLVRRRVLKAIGLAGPVADDELF